MSIKRLPSCIPIPLDEKELKELVSKTKDWVVMHGIGIRSRTAFSEDSINFAPFLLLPSTFPRREFEKAVEIQVSYTPIYVVVFNCKYHYLDHTERANAQSSPQSGIFKENFERYNSG